MLFFHVGRSLACPNGKPLRLSSKANRRSGKAVRQSRALSASNPGLKPRLVGVEAKGRDAWEGEAMRTFRPWMALLAGTAALVACSDSGPANGDGNSLVANTNGQGATAQVQVPDACTFIPRAELESLIGYELRDGDPQDVPAGESQCDFERPPGMYVTRTFEKKLLPEAAGFSSIVITTYRTTAERFAEGRELAGESDLPGVGDAAYLIGPNLMHVRAGNRGFSMRVHVDQPETEVGRAALRDAMVALGKAGVAKL